MFNFKKLVVFEESIRIGRYLFCVVKASRSGNIKSDRMKRCSVAQNGSDHSLPPVKFSYGQGANSRGRMEERMEENNSQEEHFRCTSAANGYTPLYRIIEKRHIDWYMAAASWYMLDVICIHLLPRLAEDSKRFKMGHLNWRGGEICTTKGRVGSSSCYQIQESFPPIITSFVFIERNIRNERF